MSGIARFIDGLGVLGLAAEERGGLVVVTIDVAPEGAPGPHQVGTDPPSDFPRVPPHWLHLRRGLVLPDDPGGASELGEGWWKWSRPHPKWRGDDDPVRRWVAHARSLVVTAKAA
jgi:hypothetical protein